MKTLFACAVALALFATVPAVAAHGNNHQGNNNQAATQGTKSHSASGGMHQNAPASAMTEAVNVRVRRAAERSQSQSSRAKASA